ncbi:MAG: hypothetical protein WCD60_27090, partial [Pseudolabrys sp.]
QSLLISCFPPVRPQQLTRLKALVSAHAEFSRFNASGVLPVDPSAVVTTAQDRSAQQAACD